VTTYNLASQADLNTLLARVTADEGKITALGTSLTALLARLGTDEAEIAALQAALNPPTTPPPPSGTPPLVFQSDWTHGTDVTDGGLWDTHDEFNNGNTSLPALSVVPGIGPGGRNALMFTQRGPQLANDVGKHNLIPPSTDFWLRFYFRNDDTSSSADHAVEPGLFADSWNSLIYVRKSGSPTGWQQTIGTLLSPYPVNFWNLRNLLALGVWYRLEFGLHFTDATHVQVHARIFDAIGTLLYSDPDFYCSDYGATPAWNGSNTWTLDSFNKAGYSVPVDPTKLVNCYAANNGQSGASDTGLAWYVAGFAVSTVGWIGP